MSCGVPATAASARQGRPGLLRQSIRYVRWVPMILALVMPIGAFAQSPPEDHPFARHFLALQLSEKDPARQKLVLSVANNLLREYGPDAIAIEVVTFGPGVSLLMADSALRKRVDSLIAQGVRFDVCMNTLASIKRDTGQAPVLDPKAVKVPAGVARLIELHEKGYTLVRP